MANSKEKLSQRESQETPNKSVNNFDYKWPIQSFIEDKIEGKLEYFKNKSLEDKWKVFCEFLDTPSNNYDHNIVNNFLNNKDTYLKKMNYLINYETFPIYDLIKNLEKIFYGEYDLDASQKQELHKKITSSSQWELSKMYYSQIKRKNFLVQSKILWEKKEEVEKKMNQIKKEDIQKFEEIFWIQSTFYWSVFEKDSSWKYQIKDGKKDLVDALFSLYNSNSQVTVENIEYIKNEIQNPDDFRAFLSFFLPSISLKEALKNGFIDTQKAKDVTKNKVIELNDGLDDDEIEKIVNQIDVSRLYIDTKNLDFSQWNVSIISDQVLQKIVDEFNLSKIESNEIAWLQDFKNFCKNANLGLNMNNFKQWNIFKIIPPIKDDGTQDVTQYFYIKNIWEQTIELINITKRNWISASINNPQNIVSKDINKDTTTFQKFFDWLVWLQWSWNEISFQKPSDLKDVNGEELKKIPEKNEIQSKSDLENALNELDSKWQNIPLEKMAFRFPKWKNDTDNDFDENFFSVTYNPANNSIKLDNWQVFAQWTNHTLSDFLEAFEVNGCTRFERIDTAEEFLTKISWENKEFKDIIFKDWKLIPKDGESNKDYPGINFFIWKDQKKDQTIQIDAIKEGEVSFSIWEYKEWNKDKKEPNTFKTQKYAKNRSYTDLFMLMKNRKLSPKVEKVEEPVSDAPHGQHIHEHRKFMTSWMSNFLSITEIVKWAEQMIHTIQHSLETGNKVKAAKAALFFWKVLPYHLRVELQSEVENSEKETMEKIKKELTWVDSKVMFPMIEHILQNKSAPQYEIEAAMFAVLKYGSLYPKTLAKYRWSYIWFQKLWGHKSMIPELTKDALKDDPDLVVTEEVLIQTLLGKQASGDIKPKRRSKIHKEFWWTIQEWLSKESGDGERETWLKMTADGRISYIMWEFKGSTFANGIGWMENVWAKWPDPAWKMNTIPFVIMASGLSLDLHQSLINKLKKFWCTTPYNSLLLCNSRKNIELYQTYLERVIELYSWWKKSKMYEAFQKAKKWSDSWKIAESMKWFWDTYGKELYPVINMNDGFVIAQKEDEGNEPLQAYWEKIHWLHNSSDFDPTDADIWNEFYDVKNSPFAQSGAMLHKITPKDRWWFLDSVWKMILRSHMDYIKNVLENDNPMLKEEGKKKIFKDSYKNFERDVYNKMVSAANPKPGDTEWYKSMAIYMELKKRWFDVYNVFLRNPENPDEVQKFDTEYDKFLESEWLKFKNKSHKEDENEVFWQKLRVEKSIDEILDFWNSANDENHKLAA